MKTKEQLAEEYADSQGARATTYGKSAWWPVRKDAFISGYAALEERLAEADELIRKLTWYSDCLILRITDKREMINFTTLNEGRAYLAKHPSPARGEGVE